MADQFGDLLIPMIWFDRFPLNGIVGGGIANYSSDSFSFPQ